MAGVYPKIFIRLFPRVPRGCEEMEGNMNEWSLFFEALARKSTVKNPAYTNSFFSLAPLCHPDRQRDDEPACEPH